MLTKQSGSNDSFLRDVSQNKIRQKSHNFSLFTKAIFKTFLTIFMKNVNSIS